MGAEQGPDVKTKINNKLPWMKFYPADWAPIRPAHVLVGGARHVDGNALHYA